MSMTAPQTLLMMTVGAFMLGYFVAKLSGWLGNRIATKERDPRDDRIRSMDADLRVARTEKEKLSQSLEESERSLADVTRQLDDAGVHLDKQEDLIKSLKKDLRDSVRKTRELREELTTRATENLRSEVKLREVQTELSVAQASTDMIATGVLDYTEVNEEAEGETPDGRRIQQSSS